VSSYFSLSLSLSLSFSLQRVNSVYRGLLPIKWFNARTYTRFHSSNQWVRELSVRTLERCWKFGVLTACAKRYWGWASAFLFFCFPPPTAFSTTAWRVFIHSIHTRPFISGERWILDRGIYIPPPTDEVDLCFVEPSAPRGEKTAGSSALVNIRRTEGPQKRERHVRSPADTYGCQTHTNTHTHTRTHTDWEIVVKESEPGSKQGKRCTNNCECRMLAWK